MYDCAHGYDDFKGWSFAERLALVGDLVQVVEGTKGVMAVGSGAAISILQMLTSADSELLKSERLGTPVDLVFQFCMQQITHWAKTGWPGEQAAVIFDADNGPEDLLYHEHFNYYAASEKFGPYLLGVSFQDSVRFIPLQAADLLAYGTYQWALQKTVGFPDGEPYFPSIPIFLRLITGVDADGGIYESAAIERLLAQVKGHHG
jgi:hypothetical protein